MRCKRISNLDKRLNAAVLLALRLSPAEWIWWWWLHEFSCSWCGDEWI